MDDFLAREADILGGEFSSTVDAGNSGIGDIDFERAASAFPDISLDGSSEIPTLTASRPAARANTSFSFDDFGSQSRERASSVKVTGDDEIDKFESEFPEIVQQTSPPAPVYSSTSTFAPRPQPSAFSNPILTQSITEDEPEVIREWREKQQEEIKARDAASKAKRQETILKAERAIDEFYEDYARKKERNIRENKEQEATFLAGLSDALATGTTWQRICDITELQNSQSKTIARAGPGTTDLTRFKDVLLRLKREGDGAPGAAGY